MEELASHPLLPMLLFSTFSEGFQQQPNLFNAGCYKENYEDSRKTCDWILASLVTILSSSCENSPTRAALPSKEIIKKSFQISQNLSRALSFCQTAKNMEADLARQMLPHFADLDDDDDDDDDDKGSLHEPIVQFF